MTAQNPDFRIPTELRGEMRQWRTRAALRRERPAPS